MSKQRFHIEALIVPGVRKIISSVPADSWQEALDVTVRYHKCVKRPWIFDENWKVVYSSYDEITA